MSMYPRSVAILATLVLLPFPARSSENDALAISANIRAVHMPLGPFWTSLRVSDQ